MGGGEGSADDPTVKLMELFPDATADLCVQLVRRCGNDLELAVNMMLSSSDASGSATPGSRPPGARDTDTDQAGGTGATGKRRREHDSSSAVIDLSGSPEKHGKNQEELQLASATDASSDRGGSSSRSRRDDGGKQKPVKVLTYNIWFEEAVEGFERMRAIWKIIQEEDPDFVLLQEVTPLLLRALKSMDFAAGFRWSEAPNASYFTMILVAERIGPCTFSRRRFSQSKMGRDLLIASATLHGCRVQVSTSHLESPTAFNPHDNAFKQQLEERKAQMRTAFQWLGSSTNSVFGGDMNWNDKQKTHTGEVLGAPSLPSGWVDAWRNVHPENNQGFTYDGKDNAMLGSNLRLRLDRVFSNLSNFRVSDARIVGTQPIPGLMHTFVTKNRRRTAPVLPSDHFGLVVEYAPLAGGGESREGSGGAGGGGGSGGGRSGGVGEAGASVPGGDPRLMAALAAEKRMRACSSAASDDDAAASAKATSAGADDRIPSQVECGTSSTGIGGADSGEGGGSGGGSGSSRRGAYDERCVEEFKCDFRTLLTKLIGYNEHLCQDVLGFTWDDLLNSDADADDIRDMVYAIIKRQGENEELEKSKKL